MLCTLEDRGVSFVGASTDGGKVGLVCAQAPNKHIALIDAALRHEKFFLVLIDGLLLRNGVSRSDVCFFLAVFRQVLGALAHFLGYVSAELRDLTFGVRHSGLLPKHR